MSEDAQTITKATASCSFVPSSSLFLSVSVVLRMNISIKSYTCKDRNHILLILSSCFSFFLLLVVWVHHFPFPNWRLPEKIMLYWNMIDAFFLKIKVNLWDKTKWLFEITLCNMYPNKSSMQLSLPKYISYTS